MRGQLVRRSLSPALGGLLLLASCLLVNAQTSAPDDQSDPPILVDSIGPVGNCEFTSRLNAFLNKLSYRPEKVAVIINYNSASKPSENFIERRERLQIEAISFRNFDRSRVTLVRGGYRTVESTELWLTAPGAELPAPSKTVAEPTRTGDSPLLYASDSLEYYNGDLSEQFLLDSVRESEKSAREGAEREDEADQSEEPDPKIARANAEAADARRFKWADPEFGEFVSNTKGSRGTVYLYADDKRYDIGKLTDMISEGVRRMARAGKIASSRIDLQFGGFRPRPTVELWLVPANGRRPEARPDERCSDGN